MALIDGETATFEITSGNENGKSGTAQVAAFYLARGAGGETIEVPLMQGSVGRDDRLLLGRANFLPASRVKPANVAGGWSTQNVMCRDNLILKIVSSRRGVNSAEEWNRARAQKTAYLYLLAHHAAPSQTARMALTGEPGMTRRAATITGRFDILTYEEVVARSLGYRLKGALSQFATREAVADLWSFNRHDDGLPRPRDVVRIETRMNDQGQEVGVPVRRPGRVIEEL